MEGKKKVTRPVIAGVDTHKDLHVDVSISDPVLVFSSWYHHRCDGGIGLLFSDNPGQAFQRFSPDAYL